MSLAEFYQKQCTDKLSENAALLLAKLSDPSSLVKVNVSGVLADAAAGNMGGLEAFAADYLANNADTLVLEALKVTGLENSVLGGLNLFLNSIAQAMAAYNDMILIFLKQQAKSLQTQLRKKVAIDQALKPKLIGLINSLKAMDAGDPVFAAYLKQLRAALVTLNQGRNDILQVRNNLAATSNFLPKVYRKGKKEVILAAQKIKPPTDSTKIIISTQTDGIVNRSEPNVLRSGKAPGAAEFSGVKNGDTVIILASTGGTHTLPGTYTVSSKISDVALRLSGNVFDITKKDAVDAVIGVHFYVQTIVKGVGAAITSAVVNSLGIPTQPQQIENFMSVPKQLKDIIVTSKDYSVTTVQANLLIILYYGGLDALQTGLPDIMKKFVLGLFDKLLGRLGGTVSDMANVINGGPAAISGPSPASFSPQPLNVSAHAFKWALDMNLTVESMKLIPASTEVVSLQNDGQVTGAAPTVLVSGKGTGSTEFIKVKAGDSVEITGGDHVTADTYTVMKPGKAALTLDRPFFIAPKAASAANIQYFIETDGALDQFAANEGVVAVYESTVAQMKKLNTIQNGDASVIMSESQEEVSSFESQLLTFLLQTVPSVASSKVRAEVVSLGESLVARCDLAASRDNQIIKILQTFIDTPIPLEDTLNQLLAGLKGILKACGLDKAADLFANGDYASLFGLNGKNATYIGAALEALAFLKNCVKTEAEKAVLDDAENNLAGQKDLLTINLSFNFDLSILQNIKDCLNLTNLAKLFLSQEFLCEVLKETGTLATAAFDSLEDLVTPAADEGTDGAAAPANAGGFNISTLQGSQSSAGSVA